MLRAADRLLEPLPGLDKDGLLDRVFEAVLRARDGDIQMLEFILGASTSAAATSQRGLRDAGRSGRMSNLRSE
jgi:hypothetical protein